MQSETEERNPYFLVSLQHTQVPDGPQESRQAPEPIFNLQFAFFNPLWPKATLSSTTATPILQRFHANPFCRLLNVGRDEPAGQQMADVLAAGGDA